MLIHLLLIKKIFYINQLLFKSNIIYIYITSVNYNSNFYFYSSKDNLLNAPFIVDFPCIVLYKSDYSSLNFY